MFLSLYLTFTSGLGAQYLKRLVMVAAVVWTTNSAPVVKSTVEPTDIT